jgi:hypothetical protein
MFFLGLYYERRYGSNGKHNNSTHAGGDER